MRYFRVAIALAVVCNAIPSIAEPYLPVDDSEVLEMLPQSLLSSRDDLASARRRLSESPEDVDLAATAANRYLQMGNAAGDPRYFGHARAAIQHWWDLPEPPPRILTLRSKLKEKNHDYDEAAADLELLLQKQPRDMQAWLNLANIYRVQGKYAAARRACATLSEIGGKLPRVLCSSSLQSATGKAEQAYDSLAEILPQARTETPAAVPWIITMQAEIAVALGRDEQAEQHFLAGLASDPQDYYLLRSYADLLLDQHREKDALALLQPHTTDNGILLRAAIAARRDGAQDQAAAWQEELESRFAEIRLRGDRPHGRYEARCELDLKNNPQQALALALENWQLQKETRDTRNLLEAALAANDPAAAQPALDFLAKHGTEQVILQKLTQELSRKR